MSDEEEHESRCGESLPTSGTKEIWEDLAVTRKGDADSPDSDNGIPNSRADAVPAKSGRLC